MENRLRSSTIIEQIEHEFKTNKEQVSLKKKKQVFYYDKQ